MKKTSMLFLTVFLVPFLAACAATGPIDSAKVKCPACGTEFDYSQNN